MFSISSPSDGSFRLDIDASPSELDPVQARRLRAVLEGLVRELNETVEEDSAPERLRSPAGG